MITHIAFIMDGNRRYAKQNKLTLNEGYKHGMNKFLDYIKLQLKYNIKITSYYALSSENYEKRPIQEKEIIYDLVKFFSKNIENKKFFIENKIQINLKGDIEELKKKERKKTFNQTSFIEELENTITQWNTEIKNPQFFVNIAINYSGQEEIVNTIKKIVTKIKNNEITDEEITKKLIKENLWFNQEEPQIIVRPGNAPRLSGFMLWDSQYSEIYFTEKLWPELNETDFKNIINWYTNIQRNFGK